MRKNTAKRNAGDAQFGYLAGADLPAGRGGLAVLVTPLAPRGDGSAQQASWHTTIIVAGRYWTLSSMQQIRQLPAAGPERPILLSFRNPPRFLGWSYRMWVGFYVGCALRRERGTGKPVPY
jgi:hypothetical protein